MRTKFISAALAMTALFGPLAVQAVPITEDFEAPFPTWETGWLGTYSTLANYYTDHSSRGNNLDGLWLSDGDGLIGTDASVDIIFDASFGASLTSLSIDIAGYVASRFQIYDSLGVVLLDVNPIVLTFGGTSDPGVYSTYSATSTSGIGGFRFLSLATQGSEGIQSVEGNTSIDNVTVDQSTSPPISVPEPGVLGLLTAGLISLGVFRRRRSS